MNWPFFNLVHFEEFFQKKSGHPKFVGDGTEYANRSDNFPRFIYLDSLLEVTLFCTSWWQRGNLKAFFFIFLPFQFFFGVGVAENSNFDWLFGSVRRPCAQKWDIVTRLGHKWDKIHERAILAMGRRVVFACDKKKLIMRRRIMRRRCDDRMRRRIMRRSHVTKNAK